MPIYYPPSSGVAGPTFKSAGGVPFIVGDVWQIDGVTSGTPGSGSAVQGVSPYPLPPSALAAPNFTTGAVGTFAAGVAYVYNYPVAGTAAFATLGAVVQWMQECLYGIGARVFLNLTSAAGTGIYGAADISNLPQVTIQGITPIALPLVSVASVAGTPHNKTVKYNYTQPGEPSQTSGVFCVPGASNDLPNTQAGAGANVISAVSVSAQTISVKYTGSTPPSVGPVDAIDAYVLPTRVSALTCDYGNPAALANLDMATNFNESVMSGPGTLNLSGQIACTGTLTVGSNLLINGGAAIVYLGSNAGGNTFDDCPSISLAALYVGGSLATPENALLISNSNLSLYYGLTLQGAGGGAQSVDNSILVIDGGSSVVVNTGSGPANLGICNAANGVQISGGSKINSPIGTAVFTNVTYDIVQGDGITALALNTFAPDFSYVVG